MRSGYGRNRIGWTGIGERTAFAVGDDLGIAGIVRAEVLAMGDAGTDPRTEPVRSGSR